MSKNNSNYGTYLAKKMNIKQIFSKLNKLWNDDNLEIHIREYIKEVEDMEKEIENLEKTGEDVPYLLYCSRLDYIESEINRKYGSLYNILKYTTRVNKLVKDMNEDNINDVVDVTKGLINEIINFNDYSQDSDEVLNEAYKAIYNVIKHEAVIDKSIILDYLVSKNNDSIREHLGQLLGEDLKLLPNDVLAALELSHSDEGLGYDFLSTDAVKMVALLSLQDKNDEYLERKKTATAIILEKADQIAKEKKQLTKRNDNIDKSSLNEARIDVAKTHAKFLSFILIPILSTYGMSVLGGAIAKKYKTTTLEYDLLNKKKTIEETVDYTDNKYLYQINIKKCSPWRENPDGGFIRDVTEYDYKNEEDNTKVNPEEMMRTLRDKSSYPEFKDILNEEDNTTEEEIMVTEIIQDRTDAIGHPGLRTGLPICWVIIGAILLYAISQDYNWSYPKEFKKAYYDALDATMELKKLTKGKITRRTIKESMTNIGNKTVKLQEEIANVQYKYGDISNELTPEVLEEVKTYTKKM